jgi:lysophospholipase L1-like esterase
MANTIVRETYEWSNNWWDHAEDASLPRVLLIGDSISCGYGPVVIKQLEGKVHVDRMANSRGVHDPILFKEIRMALEDCRYQVIHFNNGLHAVHLSDEEYGAGLRKYVEMIQDQARGARLIWANSTPVRQTVPNYAFDEVKNGQVIKRNEVAEKLMKDRNVSVNDLYRVAAHDIEIRESDGYHYDANGYQVLGQVVAGRIAEYLDKK